MKTAMRTATIILATAAPALAAEGSSQDLSLLGILFLAMGALVIVFQLIPAVILVYGTLKGLFARMPGKTAMGISDGTGKS